MPDDPIPPVLEYRNPRDTPEAKFRWGLYSSGIAAAFFGPIFGAFVAAAVAPSISNDKAAYAVFAICCVGVAVPMIAGIESLFRRRRRAFGLGVFTAYGMALLTLGTCIMLYK